ncbi:unnamed protein product [Rhizophagus irregularis]|nr:unnamed protein product [Rhizophagus irregularis]
MNGHKFLLELPNAENVKATQLTLWRVNVASGDLPTVEQPVAESHGIEPSKLFIRKYHNDLIAIVFDDNRPFILTRLDDSSVWYIVDGRDPDIVEAKTILICSPLKAHYKEFNKKIPTVHKLFKEWGGIPRYVLVGVLDMDIQHQLKDAIGLCDEKIFRYIGGSDSKDDECQKDNNDKLFMDLDEVLNGGKSNSALGSYFESIAHQMLRHGGDFDARSYRFQ